MHINTTYCFKLLLIAAVLLLFHLDADAQCAMCKATTESSQQVEDGQSAGGGINKGILYIMFVPYSLLMLLFGIFFKDKIKKFLTDLGLLK